MDLWLPDKLTEQLLLKLETFSKTEAYIYLYAIANEDGIVTDSIRQLSKRFRWSRTKTEDFVNYLIELKAVEAKKKPLKLKKYRKKQKSKSQKKATSKTNAWKNSDEPMDVERFYKACKADKRRHIQLIGEYADEKKPVHKTKGQWNVFLTSNLKRASELAAFTDGQIELAYIEMKKETYINKWHLGTLLDFLNNHVEGNDGIQKRGT